MRREGGASYIKSVFIVGPRIYRVTPTNRARSLGSRTNEIVFLSRFVDFLFFFSFLLLFNTDNQARELFVITQTISRSDIISHRLLTRENIFIPFILIVQQLCTAVVENIDRSNTLCSICNILHLITYVISRYALDLGFRVQHPAREANDIEFICMRYPPLQERSLAKTIIYRLLKYIRCRGPKSDDSLCHWTLDKE